MPIVTKCSAPGCETLTIGPVCIEHDVASARVFVRGRPWKRSSTVPRQAPASLSSLDVVTRDVRRASERTVAARSLR